MSKQQPQQKPEPPKTQVQRAVFLPRDVGPQDFFRARRKENGWIVTMCRTQDGKVVFVRDVYEWDLVDSVEKRLVDMAFQAERAR